MHPLGEPWIETDDISAAVAYLASDEARYITGIVLPVDLGLTIKF
jgi:(+)-trans-carveol dehydrogenase